MALHRLPHEKPSHATPRAGLAGAVVLVAEDNPVNLEVVQLHLEDLGCVTAVAVNGAEAVELARARTFDFILLDCQMPVMDGFAALKAMRAPGSTKANATTPILAVTADDDEDFRQQCAAAGFDGFLAKPFTAEQLRETLSRPRSNGHTPDKTGVEPPPAGVPVLDEAAFAAFIDSIGADAAPSLVQSFVKLLDDSAQQFKLCVAAADTAQLQALGHKLAGAAGFLGARQLAQCAKAIDTAGKRKQLAFTPEVLALADCIRDTRAAVAPLAECATLQRAADTHT